MLCLLLILFTSLTLQIPGHTWSHKLQNCLLFSLTFDLMQPLENESRHVSRHPIDPTHQPISQTMILTKLQTHQINTRCLKTLRAIFVFTTCRAMYNKYIYTNTNQRMYVARCLCTMSLAWLDRIGSHSISLWHTLNIAPSLGTSVFQVN